MFLEIVKKSAPRICCYFEMHLFPQQSESIESSGERKLPVHHPEGKERGLPASQQCQCVLSLQHGYSSLGSGSFP